MPALSKTVNAALIGCTDWLERPALIVNKIKVLVRLKINAEMLRKSLTVESRQSKVMADERRASNPRPAKNKMKTERQIRLETELNKVNAADLNKPMYDLNESVIENLASEAGYMSAKGYLNDGNAWSSTLADTITGLVNSIYTLDGETYETTAEVDAAAKSL
jgi:hypothetical protein